MVRPYKHTRKTFPYIHELALMLSERTNLKKQTETFERHGQGGLACLARPRMKEAKCPVRKYLTIRQRGKVVYERTINKAKPS